MNNPYKPNVGKIIEIRQETETEKTFVIELAEKKDIQCGQFFEFSLPGVGEAPFSISYIGDGFIESTIRNVGRVTEALHNLKIRDRVYLRGPYGRGFPLQEFINQELVIIAGGTGVSPARAIIRKVQEGSLKVRKLKVLFGFRDNTNILFRDEIKIWQETFLCFVSLDYPHKGWQGLSGYVNQHIDKLQLKPETSAVIVGPPVMINFVADELIEEGLKAQSIWVSFERLMQCGLGKCGHCRIESKYVCVDGPVFDYATAKDLMD